MLTHDYKWPSSKRRRARRTNRTLWQAIALTVGVNGVAYALSLLMPHGMWLALLLLAVGVSVTTAVMQDILNNE